MKTLIMKEKDILMKDIIGIGFFIFFFSFLYIAIKRFDFNVFVLFSIIVGSSLILLLGSMNYEELFKNEKLLNSLPIKKEDIVGARYISTILIAVLTTLFFIICVIIMGVALTNLSELLKLLNIKNMLLAISIVILLASIMIPLYYSKHSKMRNLIFGIPSIILIGSYLSYGLNWNIRDFLLLLKKPLVVVVILVASLLLYYFSYELSKKIYINKEF